jgi:hypothetical protein
MKVVAKRRKQQQGAAGEWAHLRRRGTWTPREEVRTGEIRRRSVKICQQRGLSSAGKAEEATT